MRASTSVKLLDGATGVGAGARHTPLIGPRRTFQAYGETTAGTGAAQVTVQVSNEDAPGADDWIDRGTITLILSTTRTSGGFSMDEPWRHARGNVNSISGTGAAVTLLMGG